MTLNLISVRSERISGVAVTEERAMLEPNSLTISTDAFLSPAVAVMDISSVPCGISPLKSAPFRHGISRSTGAPPGVVTDRLRSRTGEGWVVARSLKVSGFPPTRVQVMPLSVVTMCAPSVSHPGSPIL